MFSPTTGPNGVQPRVSSGRLTNRTGQTLNKGAVVQLDLANGNAAVNNNNVGAKDSGFANVISPAAATPGRILAVYQGEEALPDGATGHFVFQGVVTGLVIKASGNVTKGERLTVNTSRQLKATPAAGEVIHGLSLGALTAPTTATATEVLFDGISGFGTEPA